MVANAIPRYFRKGGAWVLYQCTLNRQPPCNIHPLCTAQIACHPKPKIHLAKSELHETAAELIIIISFKSLLSIYLGFKGSSKALKGFKGCKGFLRVKRVGKNWAREKLFMQYKTLNLLVFDSSCKLPCTGGGDMLNWLESFMKLLWITFLQIFCLHGFLKEKYFFIFTLIIFFVLLC